MAEVEDRLRAHLARVVEAPAQTGFEDRLSHRIAALRGPRRRSWLTEAIAAAALVLLAAGIFVGLQVIRQNEAVKPRPTPLLTGPTPSPTSSSLAPNLFSVRMFTPLAGWALTDHGVFRTTDGWTHWLNVSPSDSSFKVANIQFVSELSAWAVATPTPYSAPTSIVLHTTDGGTTWSHSTVVEQAGSGPASVDFVDANHGWLFVSYGGAAGSEGGAVYRTVDGGQHWTKVSETVSSTEFGGVPFGCDKAGVSFINTVTGWMTGECYGGRPLFAVTHDGGKTWTWLAIPLPAGFTGDSGSTTTLPVFFDDRSGYFILAGNEEVLYSTTDAGTTWVLHPMPAGSIVPSGVPSGAISFSSLDDGWMIAADGSTVYRTSDGGQHWTSFRPQPELPGPQMLDVIDANHAIVVSSPTGSLLATSDGGRTWRQIGLAEGEIDGGIVRCYAIAPPGNPVTYVAGTVAVYQDNQLVMLQSVADNQTFRLFLPPGTYEVVGHWYGSNLQSPTKTVTIRAGEAATADLVYTGCK